MRLEIESGETRRDFLVHGGVVIAGAALGCGDDAGGSDGGVVPGRERTWRELLERYPGSIYAERARQRLAE